MNENSQALMEACGDPVTDASAQEKKEIVDQGLASIIVPVYNVENYLDMCIESILKQTYPYFELLLVNDGSTDHSPEICDAYAAQDSRIRVIHKENQGPSATRNRGIEESLGDYIVFVDSDDLIDEQMLEKMVDVINRYHTDLVITGYERFWPAWKNSFRLSPYSLVIFQSLNELASVYTKASTNMFGISIWAKLYRADIIREHNIRFRKDINYEEDCIFNLDYFRHVTTTAVLNDYLYQYRQMEASLSKGYRRNTFPFLVNGYRARKAFLNELDIPSNGALNIFAIVVKNTLIKIYDSPLSRQEKREEYQAITGFEETQEACSRAAQSPNRLTRMLAKAVIQNAPDRIHLILKLWSIKNVIAFNCKDILKKIKRSVCE